MDGPIVGAIGLGMLMVLFLSGIELSFLMTIIGFIGYAYLKSTGAAANLVAKDFYDVFVTYGYTVLPLFVLMGQLAFNAGIARKLFNTARTFVGHIPGGMAIATVAGATLFKAICGSSTATCATFASVAVPEMDRHQYKRRLSTGVVASVGTLGILIPPSAALIVFGIITSQSIGRLFLAGLGPGLMIAFFFVIIIIGWAKIDPTIGPPSEKCTWTERIKSLPEVIWPIVIFIITIGGLLVGFFTPTEAGSIGTFAVLVLCLIKERIAMKAIFKSITEALTITCMVLMLMAGSAVLGHFIAITRIPAGVAEWVVSLPVHPYVIMILISITYLVGGSFIDDVAFMIFATPIFYPAVLRLGIDPVWFGILVGITLMIGIVIPPVAMGVFVVKNITKEQFGVIYSGVTPFLLSLFLALALLFIFPQIATFLPSILMK